MEAKRWGFYSEKQREAIRSIFHRGGALTPCPNVYACPDGSEAVVTMASADRADVERVAARFPDAGPVIPLTRWLRHG